MSKIRRKKGIICVNSLDVNVNSQNFINSFVVVFIKHATIALAALQGLTFRLFASPYGITGLTSEIVATKVFGVCGITWMFTDRTCNHYLIVRSLQHFTQL